MALSLWSLLEATGHALTVWGVGTIVGETVARLVDDFKRNRATRRRLKEAGFDDPGHVSLGPGRTITRLD